MKKTSAIRFKTAVFGVCVLLGLMANSAKAQYFHVNGTSPGYGVVASTSYAWDAASPNYWTALSTGAPTNTWAGMPGTFARFNSSTTPYTLDMSSTVSMAGLLVSSTGVINISASSGGLSIVDGAAAAPDTHVQGFFCGGSIVITAPISGLGGIQPQFNATGAALSLFANNTYSGGTLFTSSSTLINFNNNNSFGTGTNIIDLASGSFAPILSQGGATITLPNSWSNFVTGGGVNFGSAANTPVVCTGNWGLGTTAINIRNNGDSTAPLTLSGAISGTGGAVTFSGNNAGTIFLTGVNTYTGSTTTTAADTLQISGSGKLGNGTYAAAIVNAGTFIYNSSANQTLSGIISGAGNLVNNGSGNLTLTGVNTFTGGISNAPGLTLAIGAGAAGSIASQAITNNGTLAFNTTSSPSISAVISGTGNITKAGSGALTLSSGANTYTGKTTITGGTITIQNADASLGAAPGGFVADQLTINGGTLNLGSTAVATLVPNRGITLGASGGSISTSKNLEIQGVISGAGSLTKTTAASGISLILSGANTFSGGLTINQARVDFNNNSAAGTGPTITVNPTANVILSASNFNVAAITITNNISLANNGFQVDVIAPTTPVPGTVFNLNGIISGAGGFKRGANGGAGLVVLNGANTFSGGATNVEGPLVLGNTSALGTGTFVVAPNSQSATLIPFVSANTDLSGANAIANAVLLTNGTAGSGFIINGANNLEFSGPITLGASPAITNNNSAKTIFSGAISESVAGSSLSVAGTGTMVLSGTSSYTGPTTVYNGNLQVDGDITASPSVTVSGGTLKGNGKVSIVTVNSGASVNPGASPGTLSVTNTLTFNAGSTNIVEINDFSGAAGSNPGWDLINCYSLAINGAIKLKVNSLSGTTTGPAANFSNTTDYNLLILHATNGITAGDTTSITVDQSNFNANNTVGGLLFSVVAVTNNDNSVDLFLQSQVAPFVTVSPTTSASAGQTVMIPATVTGDGSVTYQWKKGVNNLSNGSTVPGGTATVQGSTTTTLTLIGVTYLDEGAYTLAATNSVGTGSGTSTLTVSDPPVITSPTSASTAVRDAGQNLALSVTYTGRSGATYQWKHGAANLANGAFDNAATVSGSQSASLLLSSVRAADAGDYTVSVVNTDGSQTSVATTLQVIDPAITQQPVASTFECGSSNALTIAAAGTTNANGVLLYQWYNGDANSSIQLTDQTNTVLTFDPVSFANAGSYFAIVTNGLGNSITSSVVVVTIQDTTAPVISLIGGDATLECHVDTYTDLGATAFDSCDGMVPVTTNNPVNANATSVYTVTYSAQDSQGNSVSAFRLVTVQDTGLPTLTLLGSADVPISCGAPYIDAGATASDLCAGDITASINTNYGGLIPATPTAGDYTIIYTVHDPAGNNAVPVSRVVHVADHTAPVVTLNGDAEVTNECHTAFIDPGVTAMDACAGDVTNSVTVISTLDTNALGTYTLTYVADDAAGNTNSSVTRIVHVEDHASPTFLLNGGSSVTNECHVAWSDPGATATDDCAGDLTSQIVVDLGGLDTNSPALGTYTITYTATDPSTNSGSATRLVTISDTQAPQINVLGLNPASAECHIAYSDAGANASDLCAGDLTSQIQVDFGGLNPSSPVVGTYTITYTVNDGNGNSATNTRTVIVADTLAPVITLNGTNSDTACQNHFYADPGASANDACAGVLFPFVSGNLNTNVAGTYTVTYTFDDGNGHIVSTNRVVTVQPCDIIISQQPVGQILNAGDTLTLSVVAVPPHDASLSYQWFHGATPIALANNSAYTVADVKNTNAGNYHVTLTSGITSLDSDTVAVTVADPFVEIPPASQTLTAGQNKNFALTVTAHGTALKYQWYRGAASPSGRIVGAAGTNSAYRLTALNGTITTAMGTNYIVVVSNALGRITNSATITVLSPPTVVPGSGPANHLVQVTMPVVEGNDVRFHITAKSPGGSVNPHGTSGTLHFQWGLGIDLGTNSFTLIADDARHVGCTTSNLTILDVQFSDASTIQGANYRCQVSNDADTNVYSAGFKLVVNPNLNHVLSVLTKFIGTNTTAVKPTNFMLTPYVVGTNNMPVIVSGIAVDQGHVASVWLTQTNFDAPTGIGPFASVITEKINPITGIPNPTSVLWTNNLVTLLDGTNYIAPHAMNENSTILGPKTVGRAGTRVYLLEPTSLTLTTNGPGRISATPIAQKLGNPKFTTSGAVITNVYVNIGYIVTAAPLLHHTFTGWFTNNVGYPAPFPANTNKILHFTIPDTNGLSLEARFSP